MRLKKKTVYQYQLELSDSQFRAIRHMLSEKSLREFASSYEMCEECRETFRKLNQIFNS